MPDEKSQGIVRDQKGQEQPADKDRARTATKTEPGRATCRNRRSSRTSPNPSDYSVWPWSTSFGVFFSRWAVIFADRAFLVHRAVRIAHADGLLP